MSERKDRLAALRRHLRGESLYVSALPNIRYLTGFRGSAGHLLVLPDSVTLFTDGRYRDQARAETSEIELKITSGDSRPALAKAVRKLRLKRLAFEGNRLSYESFEYLRSELSRCELTPEMAAVEQLRLRKSEREIEAIRRSVELNSEAFEQACARADATWTEARLAAELEFSMRSLGGEGAAFPTIVASGAHGALPHAQPRPRKIEAQSLAVVDQGAILDGYSSDMTRMISFGDLDSQQKALFQAVLEAQEAAISAIRPGVECRTVDRRARQVLRKASVRGVRLDKTFQHSTGHGVGLEIHECPRIAPRERRRLQPGMVVTVEPGAYLAGFGGVRIEDIVAVTESGCEVLTRTPRAVRVLEGTGSDSNG